MTAAESDPHGVHDWHSAAYVERWIETDVTRDDERRPVLRELARLLPIGRDEHARILDIGGGYGMLTREVLEELPGSRVVLQDLSQAMLEQSRERLGALVDRVTFVQADLRAPDWTDRVGGPFRAAVSSIAIHNVREPEAIRSIYGQVLSVLEPDGVFFNLDFVAPENADGVHRAGSTAASEQLRWLEALGFEDVEVRLRFGTQALMTGRRPR